jgi:hypothetical protein
MKNNAGFQTIALTRIHESTTNPRSIFDESKLAELADFVPGNKIGVLCHSPFCGRGHPKPHRSRRSTFQRVHNG